MVPLRIMANHNLLAEYALFPQLHEDRKYKLIDIPIELELI